MWHVPDSASTAVAEVAELSSAYGLLLDPWQVDILRAGIGERDDGLWSARQVGFSVPRQNGKTAVFEARELAGLLLFDEELIVHSAHLVGTALEGFRRIKHYFENYDDLRRKVRRIREANGEQAIEMMPTAACPEGQRLMFRARVAGKQGRGPSPDVLMLDEAQVLPDIVYATLLPSTSARPNRQAWLAGTPPGPNDDGEAFAKLRVSAIEGHPAAAWVEWAAEPGDDLDAQETWSKANPAHPRRISTDAILDERAALSDDGFARERLGMWAGALSTAVIDAVTWGEVADVESVAVDRLALAVDVSPDRTVASVALAGQRDDGLWHVELDEQRHGTGWLVPYVRQLLDANPNIRAVVLDKASPAASLLAELDRERVRPTTTTAREYAGACGQFYDGVIEGWLRHIDQPQMNTAVSATRKRPLGDAWAWNRKHTASDITPVVAATLALWGAQASKPKRPARRTGGRGSRQRREAVVL